MPARRPATTTRRPTSSAATRSRTPAPPWQDVRLQPVVAAARAHQREHALCLAAELCAAAPQDATLLGGAALIAAEIGAHAQALPWFEQACALTPTTALRLGWAASLLQTGAYTQTESVLTAALQADPSAAELHNLLGVLRNRQKNHETALICFQTALHYDPNSPGPWVNQGNAYQALKQPAHAARCYEEAHKHAPKTAEILRLLGVARLELRQFDAAVAALEAALTCPQPNARIYLDLSHAYNLRPDPESALKVIERGLASFPAHPALLRQRGSILRSLGRHEQAKAQFEAILTHSPNDVETLVRLGNLYLWGLHRRELANATYERVLQLAPGHLEAARNYCESLTNSRYDKEVAHFQRAYQIACQLVDQFPQPLELASSVQSVLLRACDYPRIERFGSPVDVIKHFARDYRVTLLHNQLGRVRSLDDRRALLAAHCAWGAHVTRVAQQRPLPTRLRTPRRSNKIRIGLMSSDLCDHPVGYFVQPIIESYDRDRFEIFCYSFRTTPPDPVQQAFAARVDQFKVLRDLSDREIAEHIGQDDLDILFELGGLTMLNKLTVCAWRPAPIQVSWLGYPHSAGLASIDYLWVDPFNRPTLPELMQERPFLMPRTWVALGSLGFSDALPIEAGLPETRAGHLTFGTANNPYKYTRAAFAAWAATLHAVPGAHFLFLRPEADAPGFRSNVCQRFAEHGISADRIDFICIRGRHKPFYNRIDIALDPFPHVGGTTTCESLWMGVPTVTLAGPAFFERLSASNLHNAGLGDLVADTPEAYVQIAATLAADRARRQALRHGLRDQIRAHPLGQAEPFVRDFEATLLHTLETHKPRAIQAAAQHEG